MSNIFLNKPSMEDFNDDGFSDGQNKIIPNDTVLNMVVVDGFVGIEEGKSQQVCMINISITSPGEFFGQKYRYNAKIYDVDASKRDLAMTNLGKLDAQAGFPMTDGQLPLTTETVQEHWAGVSEAQVKFGMFISDDDEAREINFVRGFAYLREKMVKPSSQQPVQQEQQQPVQQQQQQHGADIDDENIGF